MEECACKEKQILVYGDPAHGIAREWYCPTHGHGNTCCLCYPVDNRTTEFCRTHRQGKGFSTSVLPPERRDAMEIYKIGDVMTAKDIEKYLDVVDNELDRIHALLRYEKYEKNGGDYDELVKIMKRFQAELLKFGKPFSAT
jgi:hypothetical protein